MEQRGEVHLVTSALKTMNLSVIRKSLFPVLPVAKRPVMWTLRKLLSICQWLSPLAFPLLTPLSESIKSAFFETNDRVHSGRALRKRPESRTALMQSARCPPR